MGQRLYVIGKNNLFGYADSQGNVAIEPMYGFAYAESFENIAFMAIGEKITAETDRISIYAEYT